MTTVYKLGTFLRMYLHYAGISVADSATMNDLLTAASLPSEEEFAIMKPKQVKQISDSLNRLYLDYSRLELERRKAATFADGSSDQKMALTAIDIQKRRIKNEEYKLEGFETLPIPKLSAHYNSRVSKKHFKVTASDEPTSEKQPDYDSDDDMLNLLSDSDDNLDDNLDDDSDDDSDDLAGAPASKKPDGEDLAAAHASQEEDNEELAASVRRDRPEKLPEPDDLAELNVVVEEATDDDLKELEATLKEIGDLDLKEIEWVRDISEEDLKEDLKKRGVDLDKFDTKILIDSQCTNLKEFELIKNDDGHLKTGLAKISPPSGRTYTLKELNIYGSTIQRLYAGSGSKHYCKGALQFGDSCNESDIRICHCVRGKDCSTNTWGAHLICGHHFNSLRALYSKPETEVKAKDVANYLGSNTNSIGKPVSFKNA